MPQPVSDGPQQGAAPDSHRTSGGERVLAGCAALLLLPIGWAASPLAAMLAARVFYNDSYCHRAYQDITNSYGELDCVFDEFIWPATVWIGLAYTVVWAVGWAWAWRYYGLARKYP